MGKDVLGGFEHQVLLATARIGDGAYTAVVVEELTARTGRESAPAAVYITLQRLEKKGLLTSAVRTDADAGSKRPRRYFDITDQGRAVLAEAQRDFEALWQGLELEAGG